MKNIYVSPVVELALVEVEDILTLSDGGFCDFGNADEVEYGGGIV